MPAQAFEQRPPTVQALQFTGKNAAELADWLGVDRPPVRSGAVAVPAPDSTPVESYPAQAGDWVVRQGEHWWVESDEQFQAAYRQVQP